MIKETLRSLIEGFQAGETVTVNFRGDQAPQGGEFTVVRTFKGKGKGGSMNAELRATDGSSVTIGTPSNEKVLNITVNGTLHGSASEADEPREYPKNAARGEALKQLMQPLLGAENIGKRVRMTSALEPEFNGEFTVVAQLADPKHPEKGNVGARLERGRYGQIRMRLANSTGTEFEILSYRHASAVDTLEIL